MSLEVLLLCWLLSEKLVGFEMWSMNIFSFLSLGQLHIGLYKDWVGGFLIPRDNYRLCNVEHKSIIGNY